MNNRGSSSEMVATNFYIGWFYMADVRRYLNDLIQEKKWPISYEEKFGIMQNNFVIYGNQRDLHHITNHIKAWLNSL